MFKASLLALMLLGIVAYLIYKRRYRGLVLAAAMGALSLAIGAWAIFQSRSSTAAIGLLFLPFYALFASFMAWLFGNFRQHKNTLVRGIGWMSLLISIAIPAMLAFQGIESITKNRERDQQYQASRVEIERNKKFIAEMLAQNPGQEAVVIEQLVSAYATNRNFLLPLLESKYISPETLDRLANSDDLGIVLSALRNPLCPAKTLNRVYRTHAYPDYFFQALAAHQNTPPELLRELYRRPAKINYLNRAFAANPATPTDILSEIASSTRDKYVIQGLLKNSKLSCSLLPSIEESLKLSDQPNDQRSKAQIQALKLGPCKI